MIAEKKRRANIGVGVGIVLILVGQLLLTQGQALENLGLLVCLIGYGYYVWGCLSYAQGKGYQWLGLLAFLPLIGLVVLVVLPDKDK